MANIKYFADTVTGTVELKTVDYRRDGAYGFDGRQWIKVTRKVEYKLNASKHECDSRCYNATGKIMKCECSCGGKNHGKGSFNCTAA